jgi:replication factor C subunit 1
VVEDDSDDEVVEVKPKKGTPKKIKKETTPAPVEETTSSEYFASKGKAKPSRSTPLRPKPNGTNGTTHTPVKAPDVVMLDDDKEGDDDIYADDFKTRGKKAADDYEDSDDEVIPSKTRKPLPRKAATTNGRRKKSISEDEDGDVEMAEIPIYDGGTDPKRKRGSIASSTTSTRKRKSKSVEEDDDDDFSDDDEPKKKKPRKTAAKLTPSKARAKKEPKQESNNIKAIMDAVPMVRAPTPPPRDSDNKFKFNVNGGNTNAAPMDPGSLEIPTGAENCLAGLTFVFTGVLQSLGRDEGIELVKRYGGKVTTAPSSKTSYVVIGNDAGPSKLDKIRKMGIKTVAEEGLFKLISTMPANGGDGLAGEKYAEKKAADEEKTRKAAEEIEKKEKARAKQAAQAQKVAASATGPGSALKAAQLKKLNSDDRLWVDKYAPDNLGQVAGNKGLVEKLQRWLRAWHKNAHFDFKKAGADGTGIYRAAMLSGPPGIGKTTAAHLVARLEGFDVVETNASDTRSKKLMEATLKGVLDTTSLLGFFAGDGKNVDGVKKNLVMIMDEVDGMSAGDRGGVGALAAVVKKTKIPMILICNERRLPKMKPFDFIMADFKFVRPTTEQIRSRIMTILFREKMKLPPQAIDALIEGSHADIRQIINMISTAKLDQGTMDYNDGKAMSKAWEKHVILKPWDIVSKILRPQMFAASSKTTLNEKIELYFNDHEFSSLMLQENYLKTQPALLGGITNPKKHKLKALELAEKAANAISEGDLVDRMIHGTQQQWSLMPTHAVLSFVIPASYVAGNFTERTGFTSWLGMNSKQGRMCSLYLETHWLTCSQANFRATSRRSKDTCDLRRQAIVTKFVNNIFPRCGTRRSSPCKPPAKKQYRGSLTSWTHITSPGTILMQLSNLVSGQWTWRNSRNWTLRRRPHLPDCTISRAIPCRS